MEIPGYFDPQHRERYWDWKLFPLLDFYGHRRVYDVGLQCLGYPPTMVDLVDEVSKIEASLFASLTTQGDNHGF